MLYTSVIGHPTILYVLHTADLVQEIVLFWVLLHVEYMFMKIKRHQVNTTVVRMLHVHLLHVKNMAKMAQFREVLLG